MEASVEAAVLGDLGVRATDHPIVEKAATFVLERSDGRGGFRYTPKGGELPCLSARIAAGLRKLGVEDDRIHAAYAKFLSTQEEDGGWRCKTVRLGKSPETDASNPGTTLFVLDAFRFRANGTDDLVRLERAVEFLLGHWVTKKPLGPCAFGIGNRFASIEFPFLRYNILYFAYVLSSYPKAVADPRFAEVVAALRAKSEGSAIRGDNADHPLPDRRRARCSQPARIRDKSSRSPASSGRATTVSQPAIAAFIIASRRSRTTSGLTPRSAAKSSRSACPIISRRYSRPTLMESLVSSSGQKVVATRS